MQERWNKLRPNFSSSPGDVSVIVEDTFHHPKKTGIVPFLPYFTKTFFFQRSFDFFFRFSVEYRWKYLLFLLFFFNGVEDRWILEFRLSLNLSSGDMTSLKRKRKKSTTLVLRKKHANRKRIVVVRERDIQVFTYPILLQKDRSSGINSLEFQGNFSKEKSLVDSLVNSSKFVETSSRRFSRKFSSSSSFVIISLSVIHSKKSRFDNSRKEKKKKKKER